MWYNLSMRGFSALGVIILAAVTHATLQLGLGAMLLLYHASAGKHVKKRTRQLATSYVTGVWLMVTLMLLACCYLILVLAGGPLETWCLMVLGVMLVVLAILAWIFYYRSGRSTELWLPKVVARYINRRAKATESNTEAFSLGFLAELAEMPFSIVLMVIAANSVLLLPQGWQVAAIFGYTIVAILPLGFLRLTVRRGKTAVEVQKWRVRNKPFFRLLTGLCFVALAWFLIGFEALGGGR